MQAQISAQLSLLNVTHANTNVVSFGFTLEGCLSLSLWREGISLYTVSMHVIHSIKTVQQQPILSGGRRTASFYLPLAVFVYTACKHLCCSAADCLEAVCVTFCFGVFENGFFGSSE